jgi:hypothetical protein
MFIVTGGRPHILVAAKRVETNFSSQHALKHETEHFKLWIEVREEVLRSMPNPRDPEIQLKAGQVAQDVLTQPDSLVYNESRAVAAELRARLERYRSWEREGAGQLAAEISNEVRRYIPTADFRNSISGLFVRRFYPLFTGQLAGLKSLSKCWAQRAVLQSDLKILKSRNFVSKIWNRNLVKEKEAEVLKLNQAIEEADQLVRAQVRETVRAWNGLRDRLVVQLEQEFSGPKQTPELQQWFQDLRKPLSVEHPLTIEAMTSFGILDGSWPRGLALSMHHAKVDQAYRLKALIEAERDGRLPPAEVLDFTQGFVPVEEIDPNVQEYFRH